jgi:hypothetical protein
MTNGCPKCLKLAIEKYGRRNLSSYYDMVLCLSCQKEQADADLLKAKNRVKEIKQKIRKERTCEVMISTETRNLSRKQM